MNAQCTSEFGDILFREIKDEIAKKQKTFKSFNLIFSARNSDQLENFHEYCDNRGPTVTLLYGKYNVLFGGYTRLDWTSGKREVKEDSEAFIFFKNEHDNASCMILNKPNNKRKKSIICGDDLGPTFGDSQYIYNNDLETFTLTGMKKQSSSSTDTLKLNGRINFYSSYTQEHPPTKIPVINGGTLEIKLLQVYQVLDDSMETPWREIPSTDRVQQMKKQLSTFDPTKRLPFASTNILLIGVIGAGKSSLVNTLASSVAGRVVNPARVLDDRESVTNEMKAYRINKAKDKDGKHPHAINIVDIRGYEDERGLDEELKLILSGRLKMGYTFSRQYEQDDSDKMLQTPTEDQEIHLVCFVVDGHKFKTQQSNQELIGKLQNIKRVINEKGVRVMAVITKLDKLCPSISKTPEHVYNSPKALEIVRDVASHLGLFEQQVFPIVNYVAGNKISKGQDQLALQALYEMANTVEIEISLQKELTSVEEEDAWKQRSGDFPEKATCFEQIMREIKMLGKNKMRIICVGPMNSGKTSFIDSVCSAMEGEVCSKAGGGIFQEAVDTKSRTDKFQLYSVPYKDQTNETQLLNIMFGDTPGFQEQYGIELKQVQMIIQGQVANKCKLKDMEGNGENNNERGDGANNNEKPDQMKQILGVCLVFDIATADVITPDNQELVQLTKWLAENGIPFIVVVTKTDAFSQKVKKSLRDVFNCPIIKDMKESLQKTFRFKDNIIFPVRNYVHEKRVIPEMDALILDAFRTILKLGREHLEDA